MVVTIAGETCNLSWICRCAVCSRELGRSPSSKNLMNTFQISSGGMAQSRWMIFSTMILVLMQMLGVASLSPPFSQKYSHYYLLLHLWIPEALCNAEALWSFTLEWALFELTTRTILFWAPSLSHCTGNDAKCCMLSSIFNGPCSGVEVRRCFLIPSFHPKYSHWYLCMNMDFWSDVLFWSGASFQLMTIHRLLLDIFNISFHIISLLQILCPWRDRE